MVKWKEGYSYVDLEGDSDWSRHWNFQRYSGSFNPLSLSLSLSLLSLSLSLPVSLSPLSLSDFFLFQRQERDRIRQEEVGPSPREADSGGPAQGAFGATSWRRNVPTTSTAPQRGGRATACATRRRRRKTPWATLEVSSVSFFVIYWWNISWDCKIIKRMWHAVWGNMKRCWSACFSEGGGGWRKKKRDREREGEREREKEREREGEREREREWLRLSTVQFQIMLWVQFMLLLFSGFLLWKRELQTRELTLLDAARRRFMQQQVEQRETDLRQLDDELERKVAYLLLNCALSKKHLDFCHGSTRLGMNRQVLWVFCRKREAIFSSLVHAHKLLVSVTTSVLCNH